MPAPIPAPFADLEVLHGALLAATPADPRARHALDAWWPPAHVGAEP